MSFTKANKSPTLQACIESQKAFHTAWKNDAPEGMPPTPLSIKGIRFDNDSIKGMNLSDIGLNLSGSNIVNSDFRESNLINVTATNVTWQSIEAEKAVLINMNLDNADWYLVNLRGGNASGATMNKAKSQNCQFHHANLSFSTMRECDIQSGIRGMISMADKGVVFFDDANLGHVDLSGSKILGTSFRRASMTYANLSGVTISCSNFVQANLESAQMHRVSCSASNQFGDEMNFSGAILARVDAFDSRFSGANMEGVDFSGSRFLNCMFIESNLARAHVEGASFHKTNFTKAVMDGMVGGILRDRATDFLESRMEFASIRYASLRSTWFGRVAAPSADFSHSDLSGSRFFSADLKFASFVGCKLQAVDFTNADLERANFIGADLTDAVLNGARLAYVQGDGQRIKSFELDGQHVVVFDNTVFIGSMEVPLDDMRNAPDAPGLLEWIERNEEAVHERLAESVPTDQPVDDCSLDEPDAPARSSGQDLSA